MITHCTFEGADNDVALFPVSGVIVNDVEAVAVGKGGVEVQAVCPPVCGAGYIREQNVEPLCVEVANQVVAVALFEIEFQALEMFVRHHSTTKG